MNSPSPFKSSLTPWFRTGSYRLHRVRVPAGVIPSGVVAAQADAEGFVVVDLEISGGSIASVTESGATAPAGSVDWDLGQVWPAFTDLHTHLDKGQILSRAQNPDGTVRGAVRAVAADRERHWSAADVRRRFEFGLRCAYAHGTAAIRTHLDCEPPQAAISWPVFAELREQWAGKIELQGVGKFPLPLYLTPAGAEFAAQVAQLGGLLGAVTVIPGLAPEAARPTVAAALDALFRLAERFGLGVDLHVDETGDPAADTLRLVAETAIRQRFQGQIVCGHCCSLAVQPPEEARSTLDLCAEAGLAVVTLPMINQYLQGRTPHGTPRWRGVTLVHELSQRGVPVAIASDNCRDPFFAFGDLDMLEVYSQSVRIAHLDLPYAAWPRAATVTPGALMNRGTRGWIAPGAPADLVLFSARTLSELLARPQSDRLVLRAGQPIDSTPPDFRELESGLALFSPTL